MYGNFLRPKARGAWQYNVTTVIPHLETVDMLRACLACLFRQSMPQYVLIVDTGSRPETMADLERLRSDHVEIHYLRPHCMRHPSYAIAAALDVGFCMCQTDRLYLTHVDVLLKDETWIEQLAKSCDARWPAVGYEMSDRSELCDEWRGMVGHTSTMLYVPVLRSIGASFSLDMAMRTLGLYGRVTSGWPDTETNINLCLRRARYIPKLVGHETNEPWYEDDRLIHCRSYTSRILSGKRNDPQLADYWTKVDHAKERALRGTL